MIDDFYLKMKMQIYDIKKHESLNIDRDELIRHYEILLYEILSEPDTNAIYVSEILDQLIIMIDRKIAEIDKANNSNKAKKYLNSLKNSFLKIKKEIKIRQKTK